MSASIPCQSVTACSPSTTPGIGFQTETFSSPTFTAVETAPTVAPPLGWAFENPVATAPGTSTVSEEEAVFNAWQAAGNAARATWTPPAQEQIFEPIVEPIFVDFGEEWSDNWTAAPVEPIY